MDAQREKSIEREVGSLHKQLKRNYEIVSPKDHLRLLDPAKAFALLGVTFEEPEEICFSIEDTYAGMPASRFAGYIDRKNNRVAVARRFKLESRRFTAAHELGHWILHKGGVYFRDRLLGGAERLDAGRPEVEIEADYFAACFLMPSRTLRQFFREHYGIDTFKGLELNEDLAYRLSFGAPTEVTARELVENGPRFRSLLAASCLPTGKASHICSLAELLNVSPLALAIRLEELELVV